ncbi:MAG: hypothetical protein M1421_04490 [Candidatus Eremiobacteraeota bacterium]|nr:hypothetical protein [Candidatus Eremiobacteraeota bacterium]MCL5056372.1 hypothetical protein [Bacillota bacterium]
MFNLILDANEKEIVLTAEGENQDTALKVTPLAFVPWSIIFQDFLRLIRWIPHSESLVEAIKIVFDEPFIFADENGGETHFKIEFGDRVSEFAHLLIVQPSFQNVPAISIQEGAALTFLNVLSLGLFQRAELNFQVHSDELESEEFFQYHGELQRIEYDFRATGLSPFWVTPEIQRLLAVARAYDLNLPSPEGVPAPLLRFAEEKVLSPFQNEEIENLFHFLFELESYWENQYRITPKDSGEGVIALENWMFIMNLFGFLDRFLANLLPTRLPNPVSPLLSFMLERFYISQWESDLWPARRSALVDTYQNLIPFLIG